MYGLKEAGILAMEQLVAKLAPHGYEPAPFTPGLWRHTVDSPPVPKVTRKRIARPTVLPYHPRHRDIQPLTRRQ
jgi:hypothetical protein